VGFLGVVANLPLIPQLLQVRGETENLSLRDPANVSADPLEK